MSEYTRKIVYLSQEQYETLIENRTITVDGKTVVYDANDIYITPQQTPLYPVAGATNGNFVALDSDGKIVDSGHKHSDYLTEHQTIPVQDVQIAETSIISSGIANVPIMNTNQFGVAKLSNTGVGIDSTGALRTIPAGDSSIKGGTTNYNVIVPRTQHQAIFYGLSKVAGVDLANETVTLGTYPETSKAAIRSLIGAENGDDIVKVQDTQPTAPATKIWMPETPPTSVQVPTVEEMESALAGKVDDVQVNGSSVVVDGVANIPMANIQGTPGVVKMIAGNGIGLSGQGNLTIVCAISAAIKNGTNTLTPIVPSNQHESTFYGLAKAAGDTTQSSSSNAVGTYTDNAKAAIKAMLGVVDGIQTITVSGATPSITAISNARYICGEVSTLNITPPATGICDIVFESGSTPTVLTVPNTVKFPSWFDVTALEADTTYEINIVDGVYGAVMSWE